MIHDGESADDLNVNGLKIIQHEDKYRFTCDAVALADFVRVTPGEIADFGSGSGIISVLLAGKKGADRVNAVEVQEYMADITRRNAEYNGLSDRIKVFRADIKDAPKVLGYGSQSIIVCNPPYRKAGSGEASANSEVQISRHEVLLTLDSLCAAVSKTLKFSGRFYLVHQAERTAELIVTLKKYNLETKIIKPLLPKAGAKPHLILIMAVLGGKPGTDFLAPEVIGDICSD